METQEKLRRLEALLRGMRAAAVAFSGGVDSTFLLAVARRVLGERVLAITIASDIHAGWERDAARRLARDLGAEHVIIEVDALADETFRSNPPDRCYHCKRALADELRRVAGLRGIDHVLTATNADDTSDYRPGRRAEVECGLETPLLDLGITKGEIRALAREMGLPNWDLPAAACLASRIPYGEEITREKLVMIERAEAFLRGQGLRQVRVRCHGAVARIEVPGPEIASLAADDARERIVQALRDLGFLYVSLDLAGYRTGSLNESLGRHS